MNITQVKVFPVSEEKLKAYVSIVLDDCFLVSDLKVIQGPNGLFISMPSKRKKNGEFKDVAHPLNRETRELMEKRILEEYEKVKVERPRQRMLPRARRPGESASDTKPRGKIPEAWGVAKLVRHRPLEPAFLGSSPSAPAKLPGAVLSPAICAGWRCTMTASGGYS